MWPFSKKWNAPAPQLAMVVSLTSPELPSLVMLANPAGADGAVPGMAGPADAEPTAENMTGPMQAGQYVAISPGKGGCTLRVERIETQPEELSFDPVMLEVSGLTEETLARFNHPAWHVILEMQTPGEDVREAVIFATRLAQRLAALGDGIVMDTAAYRFFGPAGWPVENPITEFDAREHVQIHIESESRWFHTHGMIKFGRPELEIYDVPEELDQTAYATLLDIAQYVITTAVIQPGQTCGDPSQPFYAREGTRNREGHWNDLPVLELVDLDERRKPATSGAPKALKLVASEPGGS
jgi:hypothetical protein